MSQPRKSKGIDYFWHLAVILGFAGWVGFHKGENEIDDREDIQAK